MDQTRPVSGFEGFPGTDPDHHSSGWGKCCQNMSPCFYFSFGSLAPADREKEGLCQTECSDSQIDWSVMRVLTWHCNRNISAVSSGFRVVLYWGAWPQCICPVLWISVRLCHLPTGTFPREGAPVQRPRGVCGASDWDSVPSAPGAGESGEDGGGLSGLFIPWRKQHWMVGLWWCLCQSIATGSGYVAARPQIV